ncbi:MAG TPA: hypothetical protein VGE98_16280 [Thermoanaerobaculia bacterium]
MHSGSLAEAPVGLVVPVAPKQFQPMAAVAVTRSGMQLPTPPSLGRQVRRQMLLRQTRPGAQAEQSGSPPGPGPVALNQSLSQACPSPTPRRQMPVAGVPPGQASRGVTKQAVCAATASGVPSGTQ